ncbi:hypothetical protein BDV39DRAFT_187524 [Aspergillus sergii]|uniref:Uncharacterized protein n=1 Tax=Aspergillus sergii TaxID=1034303 RepID=A0A5N6WIC9_9EURO|nr:hypothetical protein BDV39DRAFT_187524 [Aspergillus sergii]
MEGMIKRLASLQPWTLLHRRVLRKYIIFYVLECTMMQTGTLAYDQKLPRANANQD